MKIKDSGKRETYTSGAHRDPVAGKGRFDLVPPVPMELLAQLYEAGAEKYEARNWERGIPLGRYLDSALRHINNYRKGLRDEPHLVQAAWNLFGFLHTAHAITRGDLPESLDDNNYLGLAGEKEAE